MAKEKLTKAEIIENIHSMEPTISRGDIHAVIDMLFDELKDGLAEGKIIELRGLGTFAVFRPGKELQEKVWDIH